MHHPLPARNSMARSESGEGVSGGASSVLEEDAVLLLWSELLHGCVCGGEGKEVRQSGGGAVHARKLDFSRRTTEREKDKRDLKKDSVYK